MPSKHTSPARIALALAALTCLPAPAQDMLRDGPGSALYIPPISPIPHWYEVRGGSWRVPLETLQELVKLVVAEVGRNPNFNPEEPTSDYVVQFRGEQRDGRRLVRLAGSCRGFAGNGWMLSERFNDVADGGKCYFEADYDPADRQFRFSYHGHG